MRPISGPQDVGGSCPASLFEFNNNCCCSFGCCWSQCGLSSPPLNCLQEVPNAQWYYHQEEGYFSAIIIE
jgi:hypothetical protein